MYEEEKEEEEDQESLVSRFNWAVSASALHTLAGYFCWRIRASQQQAISTEGA